MTKVKDEFKETHGLKNLHSLPVPNDPNWDYRWTRKDKYNVGLSREQQFRQRGWENAPKDASLPQPDDLVLQRIDKKIHSKEKEEKRLFREEMQQREINPDQFSFSAGEYQGRPLGRVTTDTTVGINSQSYDVPTGLPGQTTSRNSFAFSKNPLGRQD